MCPPKPKIETVETKVIDAPPAASQTAKGISSAGTSSSTASASKSASANRSGLDALRVDLNVPNKAQTGVNVP